MLDQLIAGEQAYSTRWLTLQREKKDIELALEHAAAAEAEAIETAAFTRQRQSLTERLADIKAEARDRALSTQERLTMTQQVNAELEALELGHNDRLQKICEGDTARLRQLAQERIQIEGQATSRRQRAVIDSNRAEVQETANSYRQIGSTITGNAFSVIRGQQTIAQAAQSTAMSLIESYAQAKVKMLADTLAGVTVHQASEAAKTGSTVAGATARAAADTASTMAAETQKTAATAAGTAARTGLDLAATASAGAAKVGTMMASIMASAAETFAGVFGFLSPVMGPAAAGPALAAQASVAAAATALPAVGGSYAVGSWSLDRDQFANVHRGEMIAPAAATPWAQSLMAAAAGGGGGGGGDGGHTFVFNANGRMSSSEARQHGELFAREVIRVLNANPSMRGKY